MSVDLTASSLKRIPTIAEFKKFLTVKVKESLKKECHRLEFKQEGKHALWAGCKGLWNRGCWFYFGENSITATTYFGRNGSDGALQDLGISELVKELGGEIVNDDCTTSWIFNKETDEWNKLEIEYENSEESKESRRE